MVEIEQIEGAQKIPIIPVTSFYKLMTRVGEYLFIYLFHHVITHVKKGVSTKTTTGKYSKQIDKTVVKATSERNA